MSKKKINKNAIGADFTTVLNELWLTTKVNSNIVALSKRYAGRSKKDLFIELSTNHDISIEIEDMEEILGRSLNDLESDTLKVQFNAMVVKLHNK